MNVNFKLLPEAVATAHLQTKQEVLAQLARMFETAYGIDAIKALDGLEERERLGSTGFGRGIAIPHARSAEVRRPVVVVLRLDSAVEFDAADGMPVDLILGMLSPENAGATHLQALATLSRTLREESLHDALAEASDREALFSLLNNQLERDAA